MRVANPIYDVVFKFLMGDMRIARLILSKILDQEIETLEFKPTEFRKKIGLNLTVFRIDFSAVIRQRLRQCTALILESNYDPEMLQTGPYPMHIKQRVRSNQGHLANKDAAAFLIELCTAEVRHVVLAHLSETNNRPDLVATLVRLELARHQPSFSLDLARQDQPGRFITVGNGNRIAGQGKTPSAACRFVGPPRAL